MMHISTNIKFIKAKQAIEVYAYKNVKRKLYKTNAAIWFNKTCRDKELTPSFINIRINGNIRQCNSTLKSEVRCRLKKSNSCTLRKKVK
jgi:hypothetical protein